MQQAWYCLQVAQRHVDGQVLDGVQHGGKAEAECVPRCAAYGRIQCAAVRGRAHAKAVGELEKSGHEELENFRVQHEESWIRPGTSTLLSDARERHSGAMLKEEDPERDGGGPRAIHIVGFSCSVVRGRVQ